METDPYKILGLKEGASDKDIKKAHRKLVKILHPDMKDGDRDRYELVQRAYEVLTNRRVEIDDSPKMNPYLVHNHLLRSIWGEMTLKRLGSIPNTW